MDDPYAATATAYDLFARASRDPQAEALRMLLPRIHPEVGPILDVGAGSGANAAFLLEHVPDARVYALEPSRAMRSLTLARVAAHPEWFPRVTIRPEGFFDATLPERIGGAVLLGVIGHFDPGERAAMLAELANRLPTGGAALVDLQAPELPERVGPYVFTAEAVGEIAYRGIAEAWPLGGEAMRWRMTYLSLDGERVLTEDTVEHVYHHPSPAAFAAECAAVGLRAGRLHAPFLLLEKA